MGPGSGVLAFENIRGRTVPTRVFARSPLRFLAPQNHGNYAWTYISSFGGGMVDGDVIDLELRVNAGAHALLMSQSATKVYRSPKGTSQVIHGSIGPDAVFAHLPDPVICFRGARFHQRQHYELSEGASILIVDAMTSGRHRNGERWQFSRFQSELRVERNGQTLFFDSMLLDPAQGPIVDRIGRFDSLATLLMLGPAFSDHATTVLSVIEELPLRRKADLAISAQPHSAGGLVARLASRSTEDLVEALKQLLHFVPDLFGDNPWARKY